jgi:hypothetical protein
MIRRDPLAQRRKIYIVPMRDLSKTRFAGAVILHCQ